MNFRVLRRFFATNLSKLHVGKSSTCDGGTGILASLGIKFIDETGKLFTPVGKTLLNIRKIDFASQIKLPEIIVVCDVLNPLLGNHGAARVYSPQKGASEKEVEILESGLTHFSNIVADESGVADLGLRSTRDKLSQKPGMGASGGVPYGLSLIGAKTVKGAKFIMKLVDFEARASNAELIITGEGEINENTKYGKVIWEVTQFGKVHKIPVIAITGNIGKGAEKLYKHGLTSLFSLSSGPISLQRSISEAPTLLQNIAQRLGRRLAKEGCS